MLRSLGAALLALTILTSGCMPTRARVLAGSPLPGLEVSVDEAFYGVAGLTARELNRDLVRRGLAHEGTRWQGLTAFHVTYSYQPVSDLEGCRADEPRVRVKVVTTLPHWRDRDAAPPALRTDWDLFLSRLREHEEGHQRIAIDAGHALLDQVAALEAPDCDALHRSAAALAQIHQTIVTTEQRVWDEETAHGYGGSQER
jgi:predicted secreted Zn-dependent protease